MLQNRSTKRDFTPGVRVMIETERASYATGSHSGGEILVLENKSVMDATTTMSLNGPSTASFTLANITDKWWRKARVTPKVTARQQEVVAYLTEVLRISEIQERNTERRQEYWDLVNKGTLPFDLSAFVNQASNGALSSATPPYSLTREQAYSEYEYFSPDLGLMNRVWIDFRDRNNEWAPGFTGFISMIQKNRTPGQNSTISVNCKGMLAFLQRSEVVVAKAIDPKFEPLTAEELAKIDMQTFTNAFAGLTGEEIIRRTLSYVRDIYCYNSGDLTGKTASDYYHQDKVYRLNGDAIINAGFTSGSTVDEGYRSGGFSDVAPRRANFDEGTSTVQDQELTGKLILDPEMLDNTSGQRDIFQKMIRQTFQIYQQTNQFAYNLIRDVAEVTGYDFFDDPRGNINFQAPKYDKLPRVRGDASVPASDIGRFGEDYSELPYHGRDYILDAIGDRGQRIVETEDGIYTYVVARGGIHLVPEQDNVMTYQIFTGTTSPSQVEEQIADSDVLERIIRLNKRFGVRRHNLRQIITGMNATNYLVRYALANLNKLNAGHITATASLHQRPDLWLGRTAMLVEEQKLGYIVGTSNSFNRSAQSPHQTTLTLAYVHHPSEKIGVPWLIDTASPQAKAPEIPEDTLYEQAIEAAFQARGNL
jgi:hypothetical protein